MRQHPTLGKVARTRKYQEPVKWLPKSESRRDELRGTLIQRTERKYA